MKRLFSLRVCLSVFVGLIAGVVVSMVDFPIQPSYSVALPAIPQDAFEILTITSDAQFIITKQTRNKYQIWNRQDSMQEPWFKVELPNNVRTSVLLSPDESTLAFVRTLPHPPGDGSSEIALYSLQDRKRTKQFSTIAEAFFFSPDGRLLSVSDCALRDAETGQELRTLKKKENGYEYYETRNTFAIFREEENWESVRVYSWLSGQLCLQIEADFTLFELLRISNDGCVYGLRRTGFGTDAVGYFSFTDAPTGKHFHREPSDNEFRAIAGNGHVIVLHEESKQLSPPWPLNWLPFLQPSNHWRVLHWPNASFGRRIASAETCCFSPKGNYLATLGNGDVVNVYEMPPSNIEWALIIIVSLLSAFVVWVIASAMQAFAQSNSKLN